MKSLVRWNTIFGVAALAAVATAAQPTFEATRTVDYSNHCCLGNPMALVTDATGSSLYFGDYYDDDIYYVATPLSTDGDNNDIANTIEVQDTPGAWSTGGWSYQDGAADGATVYIGGANQTAVDEFQRTQLFASTQTSPGVFDTQQVTGISGTYSGPDVVSAGKLVMANYDTNGLQFFNVASAAATNDGAEIPNESPDLTGYVTLSVEHDATSGLIFAYMVKDNITRRIDVFTTDGTAAGTEWDRTLVAGATGNLTAAGAGVSTSHNRSAQMTISDKFRILIVPYRDGVSDGWDLFDISTVDATETPYKTFRRADFPVDNFPETQWNGTGRDVTGSAMFSQGTDDYLALFARNRLGIFRVTNASVNDWSVY